VLAQSDHRFEVMGHFLECSDLLGVQGH
jgi:hypothetical protein